MKLSKCAHFFIEMVTRGFTACHIPYIAMVIQSCINGFILFKVKCLRVVVDKTFVTLILLDIFSKSFQYAYRILKLLLFAVKLPVLNLTKKLKTLYDTF